MKIKEVLGGKGSQDVVTIAPDASVRDLLALLADHNIGAVIVSGDGTAVDGIVSERDVVRKLNGHDEVLGSPVSEIMTSAVHTVSLDDGLDGTRRMMTEHRIRHLPVVVDGALTGIISIGDVVKTRVDELVAEKDQLVDYIRSGR